MPSLSFALPSFLPSLIFLPSPLSSFLPFVFSYFTDFVFVSGVLQVLEEKGYNYKAHNTHTQIYIYIYVYTYLRNSWSFSPPRPLLTLADTPWKLEVLTYGEKEFVLRGRTDGRTNGRKDGGSGEGGGEGREV